MVQRHHSQYKPTPLRTVSANNAEGSGTTPRKKQSASSKKIPQAEQEIATKVEIPTENYFAPLQSIEMDEPQELQAKQETISKQSRPPPIPLTAPVNRIQLQRHIKAQVEGQFNSEAHAAVPEL
jgi:hypothetical protein